MSKNLNNKELKYLHNGRIDYSKISGTLPLPNLVEIQTKSFDWLIKEGIDEVYHSRDYSNNQNNVSDDVFGGYYLETPNDDELPF